MKKRTVFLVIICCLLVCISCVYLCFKPIIIHKPYTLNEFLADSLYNPIDTIDFTQGENKVIIYTDWEEIQYLPDKLKKWPLLGCTNNKTIEKIKTNDVLVEMAE